MSASDAKYGELSHEQVMDIVQQLIDCGVREVSLTGGEPLVRRDFMEIVDALLAGGVRITTIYSNGRLVTDQLLDQLAQRGVYPEFNMSFDGVDGMPLSLQLGGFFMADPDEPDHYDIPSVKNCSRPESTCVCGHARMVMYISAESRTLPCMALSCMDIQEEFPLITEVGLSRCITDSRYMRLLDTRASEILAHNEDCRECPHALDCLGGCRASALEFFPSDIMAPDMAACAIFKGDWVEKITACMHEIRPDATR